MHIDQLYPSRFLRCADLGGKPMRVTIANIKREDIGGESKVVMSFTDGTKQLILNKTNARSVARIFGDETRGWSNKNIMLVPARVDFKGDEVDAIRIKPAASPRPVSKNEPPPSFDDEPPAFEDDLEDLSN